MRHLFLPDAQLTEGESVSMDGADFHHLVHVLRVRAGENLVLLDNAGHAFQAEITAIEKRAIHANLLAPAELAPEPAPHLTIAQGIGKGDKFEQVIQHGTEAGASAFIPLVTARGVVRIAGKEAQEKRERWFRVAKGAAEQSGRARIPAVALPARLDTVLARFSDYASCLLLHPEGAPLAEILSSRKDAKTQSDSRLSTLDSQLLILVGPEGGFAPEEVAAAREASAQIVSLGPHILRTETAALVAISQIRYHFAREQGIGNREQNYLNT